MKRDLLLGAAPLLGLLAAGLGLGAFGLYSFSEPKPREARARAESALASGQVAGTDVSAVFAQPSARAMTAIAKRAPGPPALKPAPDSQDFEGPVYLERLRALRINNPAAAVQLAEEGQRRFPASPDDAERSWLLVRALTDLERFEEARSVAHAMVEREPDTDWARDVKRHVLTHPPGPPPTGE